MMSSHVEYTGLSKPGYSVPMVRASRLRWVVFSLRLASKYTSPSFRTRLMRVDFPSLLRPYITMKFEASDSNAVRRTSCSLILSTNFMLVVFELLTAKLLKHLEWANQRVAIFSSFRANLYAKTLATTRKGGASLCVIRHLLLFRNAQEPCFQWLLATANNMNGNCQQRGWQLPTTWAATASNMGGNCQPSFGKAFLPNVFNALGRRNLLLRP